MGRIVTLTLIILLLWVCMPQAATVSVSAGGTINQGITQLHGGDTLLIPNGTYREVLDTCAIPSGPDAAHPTVITGATRGGVVLHKAGGDAFFWLSSCGTVQRNITFRWLTLDGEGQQAGMGWIFGKDGIEAQNIIVEENEFGNWRSSGSCSPTQAFGWGAHAPGTVIRGNYIHDFTGDAEAGWPCSGGSYGAYLSQGDNVLEDNVFANIPAYAIHGYDRHVGNVSNNIIRRNRFCNTGPILIGCDGTNNQVTENALFGVGQTAYPYDRGVTIRACVQVGQNISNNQAMTSGTDCATLPTAQPRLPAPTNLRVLAR